MRSTLPVTVIPLGALCALLFSTPIAASPKEQPAKSDQSAKAFKPAAPTGKATFGALAVDRDNGFCYGWSFDHTTRTEAEQRAVEEAKKRGGSPAIVLVWSGHACGAYRTVEGNVGTAFGWGVAPEKAAADAIATAEAAKRSGGRPASQFVWGCNDKATSKLEILYDASPEIFATTKIGDKVWSAENLRVTTFRNGDPTPQARTPEEWRDLAKAGKPAYITFGLEGPGGVPQGNLYSFAAVTDPRGLAPAGWHVPSADEIQQLITKAGGEASGARALMAKGPESWRTYATNSSGFAAYPGSYYNGRKHPDYEFGHVNFWSSTVQDGRFLKTLVINAYDTRPAAELGAQDKWSGCYVRIVKD